MNVDVVRQRLLEGDGDTVLKELVELYRRADVLHTAQLARLLEVLFPVWKALLQSKLPPQQKATLVNRSRKVLLQILNRLPSNDALRPYVSPLLHMLMEVLYRDNEENALLALKTVFDLHRNYRPALRAEVPAFLDLVQQMYKSVHVTLRKQFADPPPTPTPTPTPTPPTPTAAAAASASTDDEETKTDVASTATATVVDVPSTDVKKEDSESTDSAVDGAATGDDAKPADATDDAASSVAAAGSVATPPSPAAAATAPEEPLWSSMESFKAISELPLIIMLLFQCYPTFIDSTVPVLVPLMMNLLSLRAPATAPRTHPARYADFLDCQVKTLSFITYLLRGCAPLLRPFQDAICEHTVKLLTVCPKDAFVLRKDIFVAARHIISTDFRRGFYAQLETLMDDDVLIGRGRCSFHQIRPLAYSTLADMIHHVRDLLTLAQVAKIVEFYGQRIHDATLPISIQTTSIRLLLNLVDICAKNDDADGWRGRHLLSRILLIIASKFGATLDMLPLALGLHVRDAKRSASATSPDLLDGGAMDKLSKSALLPAPPVDKTPYELKLEALLQPYVDELRVGGKSTTDAFTADEEPSLRDVKSLLRTMILGVRAVIWCTANYRNPHAKDLTSMDAAASTSSASTDGATAADATATTSTAATVPAAAASSSASASATTAATTQYPLTDDERHLIARVLQNGLRCFILYTLSEHPLAEEKQMLDHFAGAFTVLDAPDFRDLFLANMDLLYACILQDHAILTVPQHFLANSNVSCWFAEILLSFLIAQLGDLGVAPAESTSDDLARDASAHVLALPSPLRLEALRDVAPAHRASIVLRLFKIVFGSVTLFKSNESALFPHLRTIIEACLKHATLTPHPDNYLLLLRALFRSISGGKYEAFYKEVFPLLPGILSALMRLQKHVLKPSLDDVLLELCLTIPARLSSLLQYLPSLMKSVVSAVLARGELAYLGLRTLEFWVDNLNPDFLYPIMTSQERLLTEIIEALDSHLLPPPYPYGELAMRILGKIGGRNRQYLMDPLALQPVTRRRLTLRVRWPLATAATASDADHAMDEDEDAAEEEDEDADAKASTLAIEMDMVLRCAARVLKRYHRKSPREWEHVVKTDAAARLSESDDYEDPPAAAPASTGSAAAAVPPSGDALLLEKDDTTLELEAQAALRVKAAVLEFKQQAFDVVAATAAMALQLREDEDDEQDEAMMEDEQDEDDPEEDTAGQDEDEAVAARQAVLRTLLETVDDADCGAAALRLLQRAASQLTRRVRRQCARSPPNFAALSTLQPSSLLPGTRGLSPGRHLATAKRIDVLRQASYGTPAPLVGRDAVAFKALALALLDGLASPQPSIVDGASQLLRRVISTALEEEESEDPEQEQDQEQDNRATYACGGVAYALCDWFSLACYDKRSWRVKLGGVAALRVLVEGLAPAFCHENELVLVKALCFVLADHPCEVGSTVSGAASDALLAVVAKARRMHDPAQLAALAIASDTFRSCVAFQETEVLQLLVVELLSPRAAARAAARRCLAHAAAAANTTASALLLPYQQLLSKQMTGSPLRALPLATRIGYVDAMAHALALQPPLVAVTKDLLAFLQDVWRQIADDATASGTTSASSSATPSASEPASGSATATSCPVSAQEYPFALSQASELRVAAVQLFRAAFVAAPDEMNAHPEARARFVGVFFRYLTRQPDELVAAAQTALRDVIQLHQPTAASSSSSSSSSTIALPKELLQQCLRPVLLNLADYRKLSLPLLDGLKRLLTLLASCFNVTLGEKLLEHLKQWRDPERIRKAHIWKRGDEPAVAAAILDLFALLPPNDAFLDALVECVVDLELVLPKYGSFGPMSSPFRAPLTRFLNKYAAAAVASLLQRDKLLDARYAALFQALLRRDHAQPLRDVILRDPGPLLAATLLAAEELLARSKLATPTQSHVQIQANAQKLHAQTLAAAQAQGLSLVQAQAKAQFASKDYIAKAQAAAAAAAAAAASSSSSVTTTSSPVSPATLHQVTQLQAQQLHAQIQVNAQKVHAQALAAAHAQGLKPIQAQEKAKQAQATYVHRAKAQAQAKIARAQQLSTSTATTPTSAAQATTPTATASLSPAAATSKPVQDALELLYQGLRVVRTLAKRQPAWLATQPALVDALRKRWRTLYAAASTASSDALPLHLVLEPKLLAKILVGYCRAQPEDAAPVLLELLSALLRPSAAFDLGFLHRFCQHHVATQFSPTAQRSVVRLFLQLLRQQQQQQDNDPLKVVALQLLVLPLLTHAFEAGVEVLDADTVQWLLREILASRETSSSSSSGTSSDAALLLRIELLKLGTLLIQHLSKVVTEHRKDVIKLAWNHLKAPDLTAKLGAYVNVCRFISVYDTPPKIVLQVYVALLRTHDLDARFLVRRAFDVLLPALPARLPPHEFIKAIKWTKKIAYEEGHALPQLVHIWLLVVRHPALFYPFRSQFVPLMVNSLNRLALPPASTPDNRRLAVSLVDLVIAWEATRRMRKGLSSSSSSSSSSSTDSLKRAAGEALAHDDAKRRRGEGDGAVVAVAAAVPEAPAQEAAAGTLAAAEDEFELSAPMVELVLNFCFRFALASADKQETSRLSKTCGELFAKALQLWPAAAVRFSYFDKLIAVTAEAVLRQQQAQQASASSGSTPSSTTTGSSSMPSFFAVPKGAPLSSLAILDAVLGILNALVAPSVVAKTGRPVAYVVQYAPRVMKLLEPCFDRPNAEIQTALTAFLARMVELYPPSAPPPELVACRFYPWLIEILGDRLQLAVTLQQEFLAALPASAAHKAKAAKAAAVAAAAAAAASTPVKNEPKSPPLAPAADAASTTSGRTLPPRSSAIPPAIFAGEPTLRLLAALCASAPSFADAFVASLLKLAQFFAREHLLHAAADATGERHRVMATPALALADEWARLQTGRSSLAVPSVVWHPAAATAKKRSDADKPGKASALSGAGSKKAAAAAAASASGTDKDGAKKKTGAVAAASASASSSAAAAGLLAHKLSVELLTTCLRLASHCALATGDLRRVFTNLLVHCLESSTNVPLLRELTAIVSRAILPSSALATVSPLTAKDKMTLLTKMAAFVDRLPEAAALPLLDQYYALVLALCDPRRDVPHAYFHVSATHASLTPHFVHGLLAPAAAVRDQFLGYFLSSSGSSSASSGASSSALAERLPRVLRQDWQASGGARYWVAAAVDALLFQPPASKPSAKQQQHHHSRRLVDALRALAHVDVALADDLFVQLFRVAWAQSSSSSQQSQSQVASLLLKQLAAKGHKRALHVPPFPCAFAGRVNVVQSLLRAVVSVSPTAPAVPPELLLHVARAFDAGSLALRIAEFEAASAAHGLDLRVRWVETLAALYKLRREDDLSVGLSLEHVAQPETRSALVLEALGCVHEAQEEYFKALSKAQSGRVSMDDVHLVELRLWEERWVACAKQLCQWQLMHDFAKATQNHALLLDCVWKRGDWHGAKQLLAMNGNGGASGGVGAAGSTVSSSSSSTASGGSGSSSTGLGPSSSSSSSSSSSLSLASSSSSLLDVGACPHTRLQQLYISILDSDKKATVDALASQTAELALFQWQGLPRGLSRAHVPLLHLFHQLVEVHESMQLLRDLKHAAHVHALPNLKPCINTWRERLPNKWEPILLWDDVLTWRSHMFQVVKATFSWSDAQVLACMHDSPWSVIRLAHTARKQHLPDVCLGALAKLYAVPAMDVQDAFAKLREQVSICLESAPTEYDGGLALLHGTNLDYFSRRQKAELFRLKALFLDAMGRTHEANATFSQCLQICDAYGKGWLAWGHYCYRLFLAKRELGLAAQTIACYLQAIHHRCNAARLQLARVLWLLSVDDVAQDQPLIQSFEAHGKQLPIWIWIVWIPQLLMALARPEAPQIRGLLRGLAAKFPQALYYTMRAFFLEHRDQQQQQQTQQVTSATPATSPSPVAVPTAAAASPASQDASMYYRTKAAGVVVAVPAAMPLSQVQQIPGLVAPARASPAAFGVAPPHVLSVDAWRERLAVDTSISTSSSSASSKPELGPVQYTEDLLTFLRRTHDALTFEMECVLEEMITKFRPEPEEELLTAVHSLLLKCYQLPRLWASEPVPRMLRAALDKVARKLFPPVTLKNEKYLAFVAEFQLPFEQAFCVEQDAETVTLFAMMDRLKHWRDLLQARGVALRLEHCSRFLLELGASTMEVPGQYISDAEPIKDLHARLVFFDNRVDVLLRGGYTQRRLTMGGSDGKTHSFLVQFALSHTTRTDERMAQMYLLLNRLLRRHKETKTRNAVFHVPRVIPLTPRVRLLEDSKAFVTLGEIFDQHVKHDGDGDADAPLLRYRQRLSDAYDAAVGLPPQQEDEQLAAAKAEAFEDICQQLVPETLLAQFVSQRVASADAYLQFRHEFTTHLALSSFLSYVLFVGDRAPHRVLFSTETARVVSAELRPAYASSGLLEAPTNMPFRLTRNLHTFVTRPGVNGPFSVVMAAAAEALLAEEDLLGNQLSLFFRDDLLSWHASKTRGINTDSPAAVSQRQRRLEHQVQHRVEANVSLVLERVRGASLRRETDSQRGKSVRELLEIATSPERQREMNPTWSPWL